MAPTEIDTRPANAPAEEDLPNPDLYQFSRPLPKVDQTNGPVAASDNSGQLSFQPPGAEWFQQLGPSERRIEDMPEGPAKELAMQREIKLLYSVPKALVPYREDIKAADSINQVETVARGKTNFAAQNQLETQIAKAKAAGDTQEQINGLLQQQQKLKAELRDITADYLAPGTTRANAGFALISTGNDRLMKQGRELVEDALKLRPELANNKHFWDAAEAAKKAAIANRDRALNGGSLGPNDPYQWSGDGNTGVPGGIPQRGPGAPGRPGRGPDGHVPADGNPGFFHVPGGEAQVGPQPGDQVPPIVIPPFVRGPETPSDALPPSQQPVEDFTPPAQEPPKGVDKGVWDSLTDTQKLLAAATAGYMGYRLFQQGSRIAAERSRNQGNEALAQNPENAARLREAIERSGQDVARDTMVKAEQIKEGEHAGKYKVTGRDGKEAYLTEAEFKERYTETAKPGEYKSTTAERAKAVQLPDLKELNGELGLGKQADRKMWAVTENGEVKLLTDKEFKQNWRTPTEVDKTSWMTPAERTAKVEAERVATEQRLAEEQRLAAEREAKKRPATENPPAEQRPATENPPAEQRPATENPPAEQRPATENPPAEQRPATENPPAEQRPATENPPAEQRPATENRPAEQRPATENPPAEQRPATENPPAEQRPATENPPAEQRPATENPPAEQRPATEAPAAESRFRPTPGAEIVSGITVDQTTSVGGETWRAVGKVDGRVVVKNEAGTKMGTTRQAFDSATYNRVEVAGEKGVFFQKAGSNSIYQYIPMDGKQSLEPGAGNGFLFKMEGIEARPMGSQVVKSLLNPASGAPVAEVKPVETEAPRRPRRGSGPSAERISGVEQTANPDGTMTRNRESVGARLIGTEATAKELLVADEVKMLENRVRDLEAREKTNKLEAKERVELAAHRYVLENLHKPEVHKALIEKMAASRPTGGFKLGEVKSGAFGVAIIASAALGLYLATRPREEYTAPERAGVSGS